MLVTAFCLQRFPIFPFTILFRRKKVGEFRPDLIVILVPRPGPSGTFAALPFHRVADIRAIFPDTKSGVDRGVATRLVLVGRTLPDNPVDSIANYGRTGQTARFRDPVEWRDPVVTQGDEGAAAHGSMDIDA